MNPAPKADPDSPFGKFQETMRKLLKVSKAELDEQIKQHATKPSRASKAHPGRRKAS
jgi:hypothetical protein